MRGGGWAILGIFFLLRSSATASDAQSGYETSRSFIDVEGGPGSVVWVVQLSDLHFSVFHPARAVDFSQLVGPALATIKPSLVLITGDLTAGEMILVLENFGINRDVKMTFQHDAPSLVPEALGFLGLENGKSKDLLTMKQNEVEWLEYQKVMIDVIERSGLDEKIFYDLRGNHDNFGVPEFGGEYDFYQKYSVNARLGRRGNVHSVSLHKNGRKHLFVGFDSTMEVGLRGPTNLFGHPTDQLLKAVDSELSQWDSDFTESPVTKIAFGHFPLSFSSVSDSGRSLKEVFLKHSLAAYLCGHLHARFGENLKRHHYSDRHFLGNYYQLNIFRDSLVSNADGQNCSMVYKPAEEFWEWEMGDWRRRRKMRILAIDAGHVSYLDVDLTPESTKTIILPTFPVDSRFMQRSSSYRDYICHSLGTSSSYEMIRALVFSATRIRSVSLKIYDSNPGKLYLVLDSEMKKEYYNETRGDLYTAQWNWKAFTDPSPVRYWIQIEAVDVTGISSFSELRPFSINGLTAKVDWKWKEFIFMGCQWGSIYQLILPFTLLILFGLLLIPQAFLICFKNRYSYNHIVCSFSERKVKLFLLDGLIWVLVELCRKKIIWSATLLYLLHLTFFPWFSGHIFTAPGHLGYMTHRGWDIRISKESIKKAYIGSPDVMVIVLPHLCFVILPSILLMATLAAEKSAYHVYCLSLSGKKLDDYDETGEHGDGTSTNRRRNIWERRIIRKFLLLLCLAILWRHWKSCRSLVKAYDMNPLVHSFTYCFTIPLLLAGAAYKTS